MRRLFALQRLPCANRAGTAANTPPPATSHAASNSAGAGDPNRPIAADTRSRVRVVAYRIGASLSI